LFCVLAISEGIRKGEESGAVGNLWWRLVRFGFRLLYNEMAWTYDWVSWGVSLGQWRSWQRASLPHLSAPDGARVLELAHGTGNLQADMLAAGLRPVGYDLSPYMGRIARRKLRRAGEIPLLVRGMVQQLPFPDEAFDGVVSTFPTEFIIQSQTLKEAHRVLKPGGRLVVVPNGRLEMTNVLARFLEWLYTVTGQRGPFPVSVEDICTQAGFQARSINEQLPGSRVWLIVAEKMVTW
jgi:ubiquinone/menaquinone biosynthesis C-methylase UbiE